MKKITLFYDGAWYTFKWLKVLLWAKEEIKELGYEVSFLNEEEYAHSYSKIESFVKNVLKYEYDIVLLAHHDSHIGLCSMEHEKFVEIMTKLRGKCNQIIWCDTSDSTGTLWTDAFPFVDLYFKKQILADLPKYMEGMLGGRIYTQFYYDKGYIKERTIENGKTLSEEDVKKIRVSWNVGLGDLFGQKDISYKYPTYIRTPKVVRPSTKRQWEVQYKGSLDYSICGYQRLRSTELIAESNLKHPDVFSRVSYEDYMNELAESRAIISPYGWGEVCTRDFEAFLQGAVLVKPDMSHLITYPNWYIKNQTYIPTKWDFTDFLEMIENVRNDNLYREISYNAQKLFLFHRNTKEGKRKFAEHFVRELER